MSVQVAVRVRPFNKRQKDLNCELCVGMAGNMTTLLTPKGYTEPKRDFSFDYSFWSFDEFTEDATGYFNPNGDKYADQKKVFDTLGKNVLDNAWGGYHCCLFAYGQTGSGKSYSMVGFGANKGIVPIICEEIFKKIGDKKGDIEYEVNVSMLEIYNEKIQDLLIDISKRPAQGLKVRENQVLGVYVDGVSKKFVSNYKSVEALMEEGTKNRTVAATQMNATSSRAHTVITIEFKQKTVSAGKKTQKLSVINLVDLAGSERQAKTQATGDRLKEAIGINQSLTTLGQVITALAEKSDSKKDVFVPYRNSALTRILQNALGGNSKTIMVCAISPASDNFEESLSTLRYADQAKKIKNKPVVNESETDKLIRSLKEENQRLRKLLAEKDAGIISKPAGQSDKKIEPQPSQPTIPAQSKEPGQSKELGQTKEPGQQAQQQSKPTESQALQTAKDAQKSSEDIEKEKKALEDLILNMEKKPEEKKLEEKQMIKEILHPQHKDPNQQNGAMILNPAALRELFKQEEAGGKHVDIPPFFENISKDFMMNRKMRIFVEKPITRVGKLGASPPCDMIFGGRDMQPNHSTITREGNLVYLEPVTSKCLVYRNGKQVKQKVELMHLDRVVFGWNSVFLFKNRDDKRTDEKVKAKDINWEFCKEEMAKEQDIDDSDTEETGGCCLMF